MINSVLSILLQNEEGPDKFVFNGYNATTGKFLGKMMFNTDFEMFYDVKLDPETTQTLCELNPLCGQYSSCAETECQVSMIKYIFRWPLSIQGNKLECSYSWKAFQLCRTFAMLATLHLSGAPYSSPLYLQTLIPSSKELTRLNKLKSINTIAYDTGV